MVLLSKLGEEKLKVVSQDGELVTLLDSMVGELLEKIDMEDGVHRQLV